MRKPTSGNWVRVACSLLLVLLLQGGKLACGQEPEVIRTGVSYQTEDGWTIRGTMYTPKGASMSPAPAVIMLAEPGLRVRTIYGSYITPALASRGIITLAIDMRGAAGSYGKKDFEKFTAEEMKGLQLDIRGALKLLSSNSAVDKNRLAILAPGFTADYAVQEASENPAVRALVLMTVPSLSNESRSYIRNRSDVPILAVVGEDQPKNLQEAWAEPYFLSTNRHSRLFFGVDQGPTMFHRQGGLAERVAEWLGDNLGSLPMVTSVHFRSQDGWNLSGTLFMPSAGHSGENVPGVVFVHGFNHSEQSWGTFPEDVAKDGMAVLSFDWRGTRKSINEGKGEVRVDLPSGEQGKVYLDIKAAIEFLAGQRGVDSSRIGLAAATATNNHTVRAAIGDQRVKTIVGLSFYAPDPDVKEYLRSVDLPLFIIASTEDVNPDGGSLAETSKEVYRLSKSKQSQFLLYDDAGRGNGMLSAKPELRGMIIRWFEEKLDAK